MRPRTRRPRLVLAVLTLAAAGGLAPVLAQQWDAVEITATDLGGGIHMLAGRGGNMAVCVGDDGVLLVDDQFAQLNEKIRAAIAGISDKPVGYVFNTHYHGDHTGGNEAFGKSGSVIVAHDNVRKRMSAEQFNKMLNRRTEPSPPKALPVVTFPDEVRLHLNGETIHGVHVDPAHTDGDSIVHFERANVIHMGDLFFNGRYPFVDLGSGGNLDGVIAAAEKALALANDETKIVPGHGPLAKKADLIAYRDMIRTVRDRVQALIDEGKTRDQILAAKPTKGFDAKWGTGTFIPPERFVVIVHDSIKGE